jgi:hypothetical protein
MATLLRYDLIETVDQFKEWEEEYQLRTAKKSKVKRPEPFRFRTVQYRAALQNVLRLTRHGVFLSILRKQEGDMERRLLKLFLREGRLTGVEACQLLTGQLDHKVHFPSRTECAEKAARAFNCLVNNCYLQVAPRLVLSSSEQLKADEAARATDTSMLVLKPHSTGKRKLCDGSDTQNKRTRLDHSEEQFPELIESGLVCTRAVILFLSLELSRTLEPLSS